VRGDQKVLVLSSDVAHEKKVPAIDPYINIILIDDAVKDNKSFRIGPPNRDGESVSVNVLLSKRLKCVLYFP
jgi:hypothetical protein